MRAKLTGIVALSALALAAWRFLSSTPQAPRVDASHQAPRPAGASRLPVKTPGFATARHPVPPVREKPVPRQNGETESQPVEPIAQPEALNERALVGTEWEREGFSLEFGADGKLFIGGRERAKWSVEGQRVRLYRDTTGEEHWLDIVGDKLMWDGQEISRVR